MKLGFVSAILPELSLDEVLEFASRHEYTCVEVMCWPVGKAERKYAGVTHIDVVDFGEKEAEQVQSLVEKHQVSISGLGFYPNILSADQAYAQDCVVHLKRVMDAAKLLGIRNVNTFIGNEHTLGVEDNFAAFLKIWPDIVKYAEDLDLLLGIENCPMLFSGDEWPAGKNLAYSPAIWRRMFEAIPSDHFGLNFDPSHLVWQMMDYIGPIHEFGDKIFHFHAKDIKLDYDRLADEGILALFWSTPKIPGYGEVDWDKVFSALSDTGFDGSVCVEIEDDAFAPELDKRKQSLRVSHEVLKRYFA